MESKGGKKKSSSSSSKSLCYEAPLGYSIEDLRPAGGIKKFRSAAYSNVSLKLNRSVFPLPFSLCDLFPNLVMFICAVRSETILRFSKC